MEGLLEITRGLDYQTIALSATTAAAIVAIGLLIYVLNAPAREKAKMSKERDKIVDALCKRHTIGALRYAIEDKELSVAEASAWFTRHIGTPLVIEEKTAEGDTQTKLPSFLSRIKLKTA